MLLPGDELIPSATVIATRAISIAAPAAAVWPWLVQLGYGRGGFYSHDRLERLVGLDIHSAERVKEQWQDMAVGDSIALAPQVELRVALLEPGCHLVLEGDPDSVPGGGEAPYDFSWAFVLLPGETHNDTHTRLVVRERYAPHSIAARVLVEAIQPVSWLMSAAMLRGIRDRAEQRWQTSASA